MLLAEDDDDEDVGEEGDGQDHGHDEAVDGEGELRGSAPRGTVDVVALAGVPARAQRVDLNLGKRQSFGLDHKKYSLVDILLLS